MCGALTTILPAAPAPTAAPSVVAKMPLAKRPVGVVPARVSVSLAVTRTLPPTPGPKVLLMISPPSRTRIRGAFTTILPAAPAPTSVPWALQKCH